MVPSAVGAGVSDQNRRAVLQRALSEVDAEVAQRRASGDVPGWFETEVEDAYSRLLPSGGSTAVRRALDAVDESAAIDMQVPVGSRRPGGAQVKRVVRASVGWYVRFFAAQTTKFTLAVARALHVVADDLEQLHSEVSPIAPSALEGVVVRFDQRDRWWAGMASSALEGAAGRVLCDDDGGSTTRALRDAGIDAYWIGSDAGRGEDAPAWGPDAKARALHEHLSTLMDDGIAGAVLEDTVQWLGPKHCDELLSLLSAHMRPGAVLVVASLTPQAWDRTCDPLVADLVPGRPLHPATWVHLMRRHGFAGPEVRRGGADMRSQLEAARAAGPDSATALVEVIQQLVPGPDEYVVTASLGDDRR